MDRPPASGPGPRTGSGAIAVVTLRSGEPVRLEPATGDDLDQLYALFAAVVARGEGFPHAPPLTPAAFAATWDVPGTTTVVARLGPPGAVVMGAYYLRPNFVGRAAHIANAGYVVGARWRRRGVGRALLEDSVRRAPLLGFDAIQFNLVFASNPARALYAELGWRQIGTVPAAVDGEDAVIYWRRVG